MIHCEDARAVRNGLCKIQEIGSVGLGGEVEIEISYILLQEEGAVRQLISERDDGKRSSFEHGRVVSTSALHTNIPLQELSSSSLKANEIQRQ